MPEKSDSENEAEMSFVVPDRSRASITTDIDCFGVYGDMKFIAETQASPIIIFDNTEVVKTGDSWQYEGVRYWFPKHEHSFVAVYPLSVLDAARYAGSKLSLTYTLPESNENADDIITATHRRLYYEGDAVTPISFQFGHLFSLINFTIELTEPSARSEESCRIHKLEMSGFGTSSSINITPAPRLDNSQTNDSQIEIVTAEDNGSLEINFDEPIEVISGASAVNMLGSSNAIIMLPQTFANGNMLEISLTYSAGDETEATRLSTTISDFKWESGRSYNYKIKLELEQKEANMVISEATILPWNLVDDHDEVDAR